MKKRIISILCALVMSVSMAEPIFAADTNDLYTQFKNTEINKLRKLFTDNFSSFDIGSSTGYTESQKSLIILDAWHKGFDSFEELNENVSLSAQKLADTKALIESGSAKKDLGKKSAVTVDASSVSETDPADMFKVGGQEFILLETEEKAGETIFFVMAKDFYGTPDVDPKREGKWTDEIVDGKTFLPYRLTNRMAFGELDGKYVNKSLPESVLKHMDIFHIWNVEPGLGTGYTAETMLIAPISIISVTEYEKHYKKIGTTSSEMWYWTRTPNGGNVQQHFRLNSKTMAGAGNSSYNAQNLRPVFYLKSSFFKEEELQKCGLNVACEIDKVVKTEDLEEVYSEDELAEVFGRLNVEPVSVSGATIVGKTLTAAYTTNEQFTLDSVKITWERKMKDDAEWSVIEGAEGKKYDIQAEDIGNYIRAVFKPVFASNVFRNGAVAYAETPCAVYTDEDIADILDNVKDITDSEELRAALQAEAELFGFAEADEVFKEENFSEAALEIFKNDIDKLDTPGAVNELYHQAKALDAFANATDSEVAEKAESKYLLKKIKEYSYLTTQEAKDRVIYRLFMLDEEKNTVSVFMQKAEDFVLVERFNSAESKAEVAALIEEYFDTDDLSNYQLRLIAEEVMVFDHKDDAETLKKEINRLINNADDIKSPSAPVEGSTEDYPTGGFLQPTTEKPTPSGVVTEEIFSDLDSVPWAVNAVNSLAKKGIISGTGDKTFSPDKPITRNEFVKMIVSAFDIELTDEAVSYDDIAAEDWSAKYIAAAVKAGIISGIDDNNFGNGMNITRQDTAVIAERIMNYKQIELKSSSLSFHDANEISEYALDAVAKIIYSGIMSGVDSKNFAPNGNTTRAMAAVIIYNLLDLYEAETNTDAKEEDVTASVRSGDKYELVFNLGILDEGLSDKAKITRGQLAAALAVLGNYNVTPDSPSFSDVTKAHAYYKAIEAVYRNNIMAGRSEDEFKPDEIATYKEAFEALIALSGYQSLPGGRQLAENALRAEPVYARDNDELTVSMAKKLFFAALEIRVLDINGVDSVKLSDKNILNMNFDAYEAKGIVNAVSGMAISGREEREEDELIITVDGTDYIYEGNGSDYSEYLGYEVVYYYKEIDSSYQILCITLSKSAKLPLKLPFDVIKSADLSEIVYEVNDKNKVAEISKHADFIYNGKTSTDIITPKQLMLDNGYITLVDTDNDNEYDVVRVECYEYIMIERVDAVSCTVLDKFSLKNVYSFEEGKDAEKINFTKNGRYVKMEYLAKGDVLAIAKSLDGTLINIYVSDKRVTGNVTYQSPEELEIEIDDVLIKTVRNFAFEGISSDIMVTVGVDHNGYAVNYYTEEADTGIKYGYVYRIDMDIESDSAILRMLTEDNEYVMLNTAQRVALDGNKVPYADILTKFNYDEGSGKITRQLIAYGLDSSGKIRKIHTQQARLANTDENIQKDPLILDQSYANPVTAEITDRSPVARYTSFGVTFDYKYNMAGSAVMFDISVVRPDSGVPVEDATFDKENSRVTTVSARAIAKDTRPDRLKIYNKDIADISRLLVYEHVLKGSNESHNSGFSEFAFVVSKVNEKYDEKESELKRSFIGYRNGQEVEYTISKKLSKEVDIKKIQSGDVIQLWLSGTEITRFRRLFTLDYKNKFTDAKSDVLCNYGSDSYTYTEADNAMKMYEGDDTGGEAANLSDSYLTTLYGDIELFHKTAYYTYPVVKFCIKGSKTPSVYTLGSTTKVYSYSVSNKTISVLDLETVSIAENSKKKAVMTMVVGSVKDIIIYEE